MSYSDEFFALLEEDKKKKKKKEVGHTDQSFSDEFFALLGDDYAPVKSTEIDAPLFTNKTSSFFDQNSQNKGAGFDKRNLLTDGWFKMGALDDDGSKIVNVTKTLLGTDSDIVQNIKQGALKFGENWVDAAVDAAGRVGEMFGADGAGEKAKAFAQKDLTAELDNLKGKNISKPVSRIIEGATGAMLSGIPGLGSVANAARGITALNKIVNGEEDNSVLDYRAKGAVQSATQYALQSGLTAVGVPWQVTAGVTSYGSEIEQAYKDGATRTEAALSGLISAGGEIIGEKLTGGAFGVPGLDDVLMGKFAQDISSKTLRSLLKYGVKTVGEPLEEVFSWAVGKVGQKLTYADEKTWKELFASDEAKEELIDSIVSSLLISGTVQGADAVKAKKHGVDYTSGLTANEETVVKKIFEDRVAEKEKSGKVNQKQKNEIWDKVVEEMEKGEISTDTIEEVLGGDEYSTFKSDYDRFFEAHKAYEQEPKDSPKRAEMEAQLDSEAERLSGLRDQLRTNVSEMVKGDRLIESYNELIRSHQKFAPDFEKVKGAKYEDAARKTLENAMNADFDNTNKSRSFVELAAKTAGDKGLTYKFKTGEQIKEDFIARQTKLISELESISDPTPEQVDEIAKLKAELADVQSGKTKVNGSISDDGAIVVNMDSDKPLNCIVGHEVMHDLDNAKHGKKYREVLFAFAKTKGVDVDGEIERYRRLYSGIKGADPEAELANDLTGEYIFSDRDFVEHLSATDRNVFQRIFDEIKYLCKIATAGSKEARELERVKKLFEQIYREGGKAQKNTVGSGEIQFDISDADIDAGYKEYDVTAQVYAISSKEAEQGKDLVKIGTMPPLYRKLFGLSGSVYVSNGHLYQNIVSKEDAIKAGRYKESEKADYHELGEEKVINAIVQSQDPMVIMESLKDYESPRLVSIVEETGNDENHLIVVTELYANQTVFGDSKPRNHVLITVYEKNHLPNYVKKTVEKGRVLHIKKGLSSDKLSSLQLAGSVSDQVLKQNLAQFNKKVKSFKEHNKINYSLSNADTNKSYLDAVDRGDMDAARTIMEKVAKRRGYTIHAYHGTARGDRVGNVFLPERATSGPMAFFTDNKQIAENYSKSKQDTSMAYDPDYAQYETQFRIKAGTLDIPLYRAWGYLPFDARRRITQKAGQLRENWDGDNELILDPETNEANGGFQWQLKEARGNAIQALTEQWLNSGNLFNDEARFLDVLEMAGVTEEFKQIKGMGELYFKDPNAKHEKVYDTFLKITKPFETAKVDEQFIADLEAWYEEQDQDKYVRENMESDLWDKNGIDAYDFAERLRSDIENNTTHAWTSIPDSVTDYLKSLGYDGIKDAGGKYGGDIHTVWIPFSSEQVKSAETVTYDDAGNVIPITDRFDKKEVDIRRSLSSNGEGKQFAPLTDFDVFAKDLRVKTDADDEFAPFLERASHKKVVAENAKTAAQMFPDDDYAPIADDPTRFDSLDDADAPPERFVESGEHSSPSTMPKSTVTMIAQNVKSALWVSDKQMGEVRSLIEEYGNQEFPDKQWLFNELKERYGKHTEKTVDEESKEVKNTLRKYRLNVSDHIKGEIADYNDLRRRNFGKVLFSRQGTPVDVAYEELSAMYPGYFPNDITNPTDQLLQIVNVANMNAATEQTYEIEDDVVWDVVNDIAEAVSDYQHIQSDKAAGKMPEGYMDDLVEHGDEYAPMMPPNRPVSDAPVGSAQTYDAQPRKGVADGQQAMFKEEPVTEEARRQTRKELHQSIIDGIKNIFKGEGFDFDKVLKAAKNLSTFSTVDNTPQRVMEKALGYKEGQVLSDITVNKVAQNETEGIKWLNSYTDRKNGLLKKISDQYNIKPGSKESAAAQMYAEGFYVAENNDIIQYGDAELAKDFPDARVQQNIKRLANDPRIRRIYDETLAMINESRTRNAYPEIPRLDNYFLHFRAMDDTFSKLGLPFNPNDIRAKDLPTDLNGVTADLKPGQPYFASAMHRTGKRTSFDLLGGLERYLTSAKNQIYHIDDIQTLRALRNYIADTYGQANGLEGLDALSEEEAQERIEKVFDAHLSTFAKFLNEEANILAGKTALIDRGLEGIIGRRGITFLNTVNGQVGSNMVGFNVSSSLTNFLPVVQTFAKSNKADFVKAFAQTVSNKIGSIYGKTDGFAESSPVMIRRKGADRFYRTPWQKAGDAGYVLMSAVDDISTELIARTKYNEFVRNGMDAQKAHYETDKWVSRLMGDRSLGQMPQIYNSKMLGLVTKFQLEVRNQLDSQFYDTIQEAKVSNEHIEDGLARNAKIAAKCASTFVQLAVVQHLFGKAFESIAGYNPAFDIIGVLMTAFGFDDEEDSEDTALDNIEQGFLELLEDLPYAGTFTGGRIPISSALPITELVKGEDEWGNEKSRWKTLGEIAPYYLMPGGYGQVKKTAQGLSMFSDDHPIAGSYTNSGNLRFPVDDTLGNRIQAGIFGQYASKNARDYFDNERSPLKEKQIQEFIDVDIPIRDYWEYREGLSGLSKLEEKADYIAGLDLPIDKKNLLLNNIADREEKIDLTGYEDFNDFEEFDFAVKNPEKYEIAQKVGGFEAYMEYREGMKDMKLAEKAEYIAGLDLTDAQKNALINGETDRKEPIDMTGYDPSVYSSFEEFEFAKDSPETYAVAKAVGGYEAYKGYSGELYDIHADKDQYGKSISGSRKAKVLDYINNLDADYYTKIILWKSEYTSDDTYNNEIIEYLNGREDISFEEEIEILRKLGFKVTDDGHISW